MKQQHQIKPGKSYNIYRGVSSLVVSLIIGLIVYSFIVVDVPGEEGQGKESKTRYIVKEGDTLWTIAEEYLKDPFLWPNIWRENPSIKDPDFISTGEELIIPNVITSMPLMAEEGILPPSTGTVVPAPPPPAGAAVPVTPKEEAVLLPPAEGSVPLPPAEATIPLPPIDVTLPVLPKENAFMWPTPAERKREKVGSESCRICHEEQFKKWNDTIHAKWHPSFLEPDKVKESKIECETCHGPANLHLEDNSNYLVITSFGPFSKDTREEQNAVCIGCHGKSGLHYWKGGAHGRSLRCVDCHQVMQSVSKRNLLKSGSEMEICLKCHIKEKGKIFRSPHLSHDEAKMTCSTCHSPHGSDTPGLLTSSSINENCYKCHTEKRGPYLFDHLPVQENCLLCHDPHASVNNALLKVRQPFLCLECHTNLPRNLPSGIDRHDVFNPHSGFTYYKGCTNCHPMIHGSRHPSGVRLQR